MSNSNVLKAIAIVLLMWAPYMYLMKRALPLMRRDTIQRDKFGIEVLDGFAAFVLGLMVLVFTWTLLPWPTAGR